MCVDVHFKPLKLTVRPMGVDLMLRGAIFWPFRPYLRPLGFLLMSLEVDFWYPRFKFLGSLFSFFPQEKRKKVFL